MPRNCSIAFVIWLALMAGYTAFLWHRFDEPARYIVGPAAGMLVTMGLGMLNGARYARRDRNAREAILRGERPRDGELVAAIGTITPAMDALEAPFSGRDCVAYQYSIGQSSGAEKDYAGFAFTRCSVHTPAGSFALGNYPVLTNYPSDRGDVERAREYIASTKFERMDNIVHLAKSTFGLYYQPPPMRVDWTIGTPPQDRVGPWVSETVVTSGSTVTAIGRYSARDQSIVSDNKDKGYLRLFPGMQRDTSSGIGQMIGGVLMIIAVNVALWFVLPML